MTLKRISFGALYFRTISLARIISSGCNEASGWTKLIDVTVDDAVLVIVAISNKGTIFDKNFSSDFWRRTKEG
jgi:hypothetical protein